MREIKQDLKVTLLQTELHWQNPEANLAMLEEKLWQLPKGSDLIVLPEMFNTGFSMEAESLAEPMNLTTFKWMQQQAAQHQAVIVGSFIVKEQGHYYNRLIWMPPNGDFKTYDKRHLFRMAGEHHTFSAGTETLICEWKGWRIMPLVCYDLRFPVWSRNVDLAYDLLIYVANWPKARRSAWKVLLQARAVENLCYCVGVNRVGEDGNGIAYSGDSAVVDFKGEHLWQESEKDCFTQQTLSAEALKAYRQKFPAQLDADRFQLLP